MLRAGRGGKLPPTGLGTNHDVTFSFGGQLAEPLREPLCPSGARSGRSVASQRPQRDSSGTYVENGSLRVFFWRSRSSAPNPASRGANRRRCPARYALEPLALNRFESLVCRFSGGMRFQYGQRFASRQPYRRLVLSCRLGECLLHGGIVMFQFSQYFGGNTAD